MPLKPFCCALFLVLTLLIPLTVLAEPSQAEREIQHLIAFIGNSPCRFIRNGQAYDAADARQHILRKYDAARRRIETAEHFIRYCATQSSMSGKPYHIQCSDRTVLCADWLQGELQRFRRE